MTEPAKFVADPGSIAAVNRKMREGCTDPVRLLEASLARIDAVEREVQGWRLIDRDGAMAQAEGLRAAAADGSIHGPLHGIPVAIKDVIDVAGLPTRAGSRTRDNIAPGGIDASVVAQLRTAGAIILGKAHTTEFAYFDGPPPTRNPHNLMHTPGGSSAGPAAVVAAGMVPLSLGTQTAGSVSRPAAYCGIAAFKPSTLSWPGFGVVPFAPSFDTVGIFGYRTVDAMVGARALMPPFLRPAKAETGTSAMPTVGFIEDAILDAASDAVAKSLAAVSEKLTAAGVHVVRKRSQPAFADLLAWHKTVTEYELARAHPLLLQAPEGDVTPALLDAINRGRAIDDHAYVAALRALAAARERFWGDVGDFDALIFPAAPDTAPAGRKTGDPRFIIPFTALGGPIVSIPVGFHQGLPLGIMLAGAPGTDWMLADLADRLAPFIETPR